MNTEDNEMIQTPWGKKRWSTIRQAFEQREELLAALRDVAEELKHAAHIVNLDKEAIGRAKTAIAKATGEPVMAA
jgi:hypothetical protein